MAFWLLFSLALAHLRGSLSTTEAPVRMPQFTHCRSPELDTFTCWWTVGDFHNLSGPGEIKVIYKTGNKDTWRECPEYINAGENGCYFNSSYVDVWSPYCLKLLTKRGDLEYDKSCFSVDEIAMPKKMYLRPEGGAPLEQLSSSDSIHEDTTDTDLQAPLRTPQFTHCRSPEQVTFTCWWTVGDFHNLSGPGKLKVIYKKGKVDPWRECPEYINAEENGCYFNSSYADVWTPYCLKLLTTSGNVEFDESCFSVDEIVRPDPPINLNWTLLNISLSGLFADIRVSWESPPSADVQNGWIALVYELQYKERNETQWEQVEPTVMTTVPIYSVVTGREYEIRVRCKQRSFEKYGEFSNTVYVSVPRIVTEKDNEFPMIFVLTFGTVGIAMVLLLLIFSKQQRLKLLILPPVPVPKIKGIDPELLKKGRLNELNSVLASSYASKPEVYMDDAWVEFIEIDIDDHDEKNHESDTEKLLGDDRLKSHSCHGIKDDDSGRDSCYEPDIPETDDTMDNPCYNISDQSQEGMTKEDLLCLDEKDSNKSPLYSTSDSAMPSALQPEKVMSSDPSAGSLACDESRSNRPPVHTQLSNQSSANMDFYAQVSDITPAGGVLLSPGQQSKVEKMESKDDSKEPSKCQMPMIVSSAYTSEVDAKKFNSINKESKPILEKSFDQGSYFTTESLTPIVINPGTAGEYQQSSVMPVPDYTSIQMVDSQQSLLLNPDALSSRCFPKPPYVTPDQLSSVMP